MLKILSSQRKTLYFINSRAKITIIAIKTTTKNEEEDSLSQQHQAPSLFAIGGGYGGFKVAAHGGGAKTKRSTFSQESAKNTTAQKRRENDTEDEEKAKTTTTAFATTTSMTGKEQDSSFFVALARVDISDYASRVDQLYRWYLDREGKDFDEDEERNVRGNTTTSSSRCCYHHQYHHHPGVAIQKYLNENYFEPLAKLASKHEGTVLNFAGDAACCVFRERRRCDGTRETDDEEEDEDIKIIINGDETKARVTKRAESFAEEVVKGRWLFSNRPRRRAEKAREEEAQRAHFFFRDVRVRIAVASGNVTQTFLGGFQGRYERVLFGEACEKLAKEARKAKPRELLLANDEYDDPERKRRFIRREKKRRNIRIKALTPSSKSQRDETVAIVFIHVTLRASMSTREVQTLRRFVQRAQKVCARHDGTFLQRGGDEGDSLAIVVAFRTQFAKDSLLAKFVASRNALRFSRTISRSLEKKNKNEIKIERKGNKTTTTTRRRPPPRRRQRREQHLKITLGVSLGSCCLGFVGDLCSQTSSHKAFLATGRAVNRAARFAKGELLKRTKKSSKNHIVRVDANAVYSPSSKASSLRKKIRVKGGEVWDALAF